MFGKHRLAASSAEALAAAAEAGTVAARRRALVALHSRGASGAARSKTLHASLLAHPLCWSNRVRPQTPAPIAIRQAPSVEAAPPVAEPRPIAPHHAQRPMLVPAGSWNTHLPWGAAGLARMHGPLVPRERP